MKHRGKRQLLEGKVVGDGMEKTVVVEVSRRFRHSMYQKYLTSKKKYLVHVEGKDCGLGDTVRIISSRPLSKRKRWRVAEVVRKGKKE